MNTNNIFVLPLLGAICGDIIGSWFEFRPTKNRDFELFHNKSQFADDTVCSIAIADALMNRQYEWQSLMGAMPTLRLP